MKNNFKLDVDHTNQQSAEYFINSIDEELFQLPFDMNGIAKAESIIAGYKFRNASNAVLITILFASSYGEANDVAKYNFYPGRPNKRCTQNGSVIYVVESDDVEKVDELLSLFAGKE